MNFTSRYIRHRNFLGELEEIAVGQEKDFGFRILTTSRDVAGLQSITLQPVNFPDHRFRFGPPDFRVRLADCGGSCRRAGSAADGPGSR